MFSALNRFIAARYFGAKRQNGKFLSFIRIMAIGGVAVGSAGLLMALSIVHGFKSVIHNKIMSYGPEIVIQTFSDYPMYRSDTLLTFLSKEAEILAAQPVIESQIMIQIGDRVEGVFLRGLESEDRITKLPEYVKEGGYISVNDEILLGAKLAKNLNATINESAFIYSINGVPSRLNPPDIRKATVHGIYEIGIDKLDEAIVIAPIEWSRKLLNYQPHQIDKVFIKTKPGTDIKAYNALLNDKLPYPMQTESVYETYGSIFAWVNLQEQTIPLVIGVMIIVAAFNLIGTILMMVLERTRDIGILKAMGANDKTIKSIFLIQGSLIAISGLAIGILISYTFFWLQTTYSIIPLPQENYYMSTAPVEPHLMDVFLVSIITFVLSWLASYLPAKVASQIQPLKVIAFGKA
ncbi:ABC transporter permease [bacterium]|nr:MAG: ABC transporter permease [bacterium]